MPFSTFSIKWLSGFYKEIIKLFWLGVDIINRSGPKLAYLCSHFGLEVFFDLYRKSKEPRSVLNVLFCLDIWFLIYIKSVSKRSRLSIRKQLEWHMHTHCTITIWPLWQLIKRAEVRSLPSGKSHKNPLQ